MIELWKNLMEVSLALGAVIALLLIMTPLFNRRYTAKWRYWLWLAIAVRLIIPLNMNVFKPAVNVTMPEREITYTTAPIMGFGSAEKIVEVQDSETKQVLESENVLTKTVENNNKTVRNISFQKLVIAVWSIVAVAIMLFRTIAYLFFRRKIKRWSRPCKADFIKESMLSAGKACGFNGKLKIQVCSYINGPMVVGLIKPILLLPNENYTTTELNCIFRHEIIHCMRGDIIYKLFLQLATALHWFNPAVWVMRKEAGRDIEISCDEAVTKGKDKNYCYQYAQTILNTVSSAKRYSSVLTTEFGGGEKIMKKELKICSTLLKSTVEL